jgi:hypothetical protein
MLPPPPKVLLLGLGLFLAGTFFVLLAFDGGSRTSLAVGVGLLLAGAGSVSLGAWLAPRRGDPLDQRRERRLWKSGPLGRKWLEGRRKTP